MLAPLIAAALVFVNAPDATRLRCTTATYFRHLTQHVALVASCEEFFGLLALVELIRFDLGTLCLS